MNKRTSVTGICKRAGMLVIAISAALMVVGCATTSQQVESDAPDPHDTADAPDAADAAEESRMIQYFVALLYAGPNREGSEEEIMRIQRGHRARIRELAESGHMVLAGPFGDGGDLRGLFIYDVATMEEAQALADSDPAIQAGRLRAEIHPWWGARGLRDLE